MCSWVVGQPSQTHKYLWLQADWPDLARIPALLSAILTHIPRYIPAAIRGNVTSGLVRVVRKARTDGKLDFKYLGFTCQALRLAVSCLTELMRYDTKHRKEVWRSAVNAEIVPVLIDLLTAGHEQTVSTTLELSGMLLVSAPEGEVARWGVGLVHATTRVLTGHRPVAVRHAAEMLHKVGMAHPCLIADCHTWGIDNSLQQLTMHSDPGTAAAACQLKKLLSGVKPAPDVSPQFESHVSSYTRSLTTYLCISYGYVGLLLCPIHCPTSKSQCAALCGDAIKCLKWVMPCF
jgi:hypothetical protein